MNEWQPIETAPKDSTEMFIVRGFGINSGSVRNYTTDAYAVWSEKEKFIRWPHVFQPTHWMPLPPPPK